MLRALPLILPLQLRQEIRNLKPNQTTSLSLGSPFRTDLQQRKPRTHKFRNPKQILLPAVRQAPAKAARKKNSRVKKKRNRDQGHLKMRGVMRKGASPSLPRGRRKMKGLRPPVSFALCGSAIDNSQSCCAVLCCAVLCCAVLCCAVLCCAATRHRNLCSNRSVITLSVAPRQC